MIKKQVMGPDRPPAPRLRGSRVFRAHVRPRAPRPAPHARSVTPRPRVPSPFASPRREARARARVRARAEKRLGTPRGDDGRKPNRRRVVRDRRDARRALAAPRPRREGGRGRVHEGARPSDARVRRPGSPLRRTPSPRRTPRPARPLLFFPLSARLISPTRASSPRAHASPSPDHERKRTPSRPSTDGRLRLRGRRVRPRRRRDARDPRGGGARFRRSASDDHAPPRDRAVQSRARVAARGPPRTQPRGREGGGVAPPGAPVRRGPRDRRRGEGASAPRQGEVPRRRGVRRARRRPNRGGLIRRRARGLGPTRVRGRGPGGPGARRRRRRGGGGVVVVGGGKREKKPKRVCTRATRRRPRRRRGAPRDALLGRGANRRRAQERRREAPARRRVRVRRRRREGRGGSPRVRRRRRRA